MELRLLDAAVIRILLTLGNDVVLSGYLQKGYVFGRITEFDSHN